MRAEAGAIRIRSLFAPNTRAIILQQTIFEVFTAEESRIFVLCRGRTGFEPKTCDSVLFLPMSLYPSLRARLGGVSAGVSAAGYTDITMRVASIAPCLGSGTWERERSESDNVDRERERSDNENPFAPKPWF